MLPCPRFTVTLRKKKEVYIHSIPFQCIPKSPTLESIYYTSSPSVDKKRKLKRLLWKQEASMRYAGRIRSNKMVK